MTQYTNYHGQSVAAKDIASYSDYLDRYEEAGTAASNWMHDDSNIHFANYVRDNDEVWEKWTQSGKTDKKDMWDFGHQDWNTGGGKMKDRHVAKILTNPGDLNKTGSEWDDMGVVSAFKSGRWGYDQEAQDKLTASFAKDHWGKAGYNEGREMHWYDADDKDNSFATTKGVPFSKEWNPDDAKMTSAYDEWKGKADENIHYGKYVDTHKDLTDEWTTHVKPHGNKSKWDWGKEHYTTLGQDENRGVSYILDRPGDLDGDGNEYNDMVTTAGTNNPTHLFGTDATKGKWSEYYWKNNPLATYAPESAMSAPDREPKVVDKPTSTSTSTNTSNSVFNTPSHSNTTGTTGTNQNSENNGGTYSPKEPGWNEPPRDPKPTPSGYGVNPIGSSADDPLTGDTYIGRGWANYWQQSIPDKDPNWSERFNNQYVKFGDQNQVIDRDNLVKRIQARSQHHMDQSDYLGYLSRGQMRGENRPKWNQPGPISSDYQPDIDVGPFIDKIYDIGKD